MYESTYDERDVNFKSILSKILKNNEAFLSRENIVLTSNSILSIVENSIESYKQILLQFGEEFLEIFKEYLTQYYLYEKMMTSNSDMLEQAQRKMQFYFHTKMTELYFENYHKNIHETRPIYYGFLSFLGGLVLLNCVYSLCNYFFYIRPYEKKVQNSSFSKFKNIFQKKENFKNDIYSYIKGSVITYTPFIESIEKSPVMLTEISGPALVTKIYKRKKDNTLKENFLFKTVVQPKAIQEESVVCLFQKFGSEEKVYSYHPDVVKVYNRHGGFFYAYLDRLASQNWDKNKDFMRLVVEFKKGKCVRKETGDNGFKLGSVDVCHSREGGNPFLKMSIYR